MPVFAKLEENNIDFAENLIGLYSKSVGEKKGFINESVSELEDWTYDYRFVRGLAALLDRECLLETKSSTNPIDARRELFRDSAEMGLPTTEEERHVILSRVAEKLKVDTDSLEGSMYGDLEDEMVLTSFKPPDPIDLLKKYNLSLTQTLLFNASEVSFTTSGNWQRIFRKIKWLGLIYTIRQDGSDYWVRIDGPISLFKLNRRYGTSLAKLLPLITDNKTWRLRAKVISPASNILLDLELDSTRHGSYLLQSTAEEVATFDSSVEEDFASRFMALGTGWELTREPDPLPVGQNVMIPDFLFKKGDLKVYLEIMGFWTPEYIDDKLKKLNMVNDVDLIVAVDRRLACQIPSEKSERLNLIFYKGEVPLSPILRHLQDRQRYLVDGEVKSVRSTELKFVSPVVGIDEIAKILSISVEAVKTMIDKFSVPGYRRLDNIFVRETLLREIELALEDRVASGRLSLDEAGKLINSFSITDPTVILVELGYQIIWHGINPESAEIKRRVKSSQK